MTEQIPRAPRSGLAGLVDRGRSFHPLVKAARLGVTGGYRRKLDTGMARDLVAGDHDFVLELGCGDAPLLKHARPRRYVGLDMNEGSLEAARRRHAGVVGAQFIRADIAQTSLVPWRGADTVVTCSFFHHLPDQGVADLSRRILEEVGPKRLVCSDGVMQGPMKNAIVWLDEGEPSRPKEELYALLSADWDLTATFAFDVPFGTVHEFGFVGIPRR